MQNFAFIVAIGLLGLGATLNLIVMLFLGLNVLHALRPAGTDRKTKERASFAPAPHHT